MYQVLARKLRPKSFADVAGQDHITKSLRNAIIKNKLGHAYIFSGTRGVGKTTVARIFAKAIRCENRTSEGDPCSLCRSCKDFETASSMDVLEFDGASNNSVDDIRDLVLNVQYLPTFGQYKIYIIDEVHMLSTSAFNALLKTLEEPPSHVIFIFATTEPNKLLDTVLSRCQRFDFLNASMESLSKLIKKIALTENINFENENLVERLCESGNESFRDTLSLLDQALSFSDNGNISEEVFVTALGLAGPSAIESLVDSILECDLVGCSKIYRELLSENISLLNISRSILDRFYYILQNNPEGHKNIKMAELYWVYEVFSKEINWNLESLSPKKTTELLLQKLCLRRQIFKQKLTLDDQDKKKDKIEDSLTSTSQISKSDSEAEGEVEPEIESEPEEIKAPIESMLEVASKDLQNKLDKSWGGFIKYLSGISPASSSTLEQGNIIKPLVVKDGSVNITLGFSNASKVFLDYLKDNEAYKALMKNLSNYFQTPEDQIHLELDLVDTLDEEEFVSIADIKQKKVDEVLENKKEKILTDPLIKEAEKMFNSSIDKVVLSKNK